MVCFSSPVFLFLIELSLSSHILRDAQEIPQSTSDLTKWKLTKKWRLTGSSRDMI